MKTFYKGIAAPLASYGIIKATTFGERASALALSIASTD